MVNFGLALLNVRALILNPKGNNLADHLCWITEPANSSAIGNDEEAFETEESVGTAI